MIGSSSLHVEWASGGGAPPRANRLCELAITLGQEPPWQQPGERSMARLFIGIIRVSTASGFLMRQLTHESQSVWGTKVLERGLNYRLDRESPAKWSPPTLSKNLGPLLRGFCRHGSHGT